MGGGGGAPPVGMGGGGGAPPVGIGGGGGGAAGTIPFSGSGVGIPWSVVGGGSGGRLWGAIGDAVALGGPIPPKSTEASWRAEPLVGPSSSESESSFSEPTTLQSSSSAGLGVRRADCAAGSGKAVLVVSC